MKFSIARDNVNIVASVIEFIFMPCVVAQCVVRKMFYGMGNMVALLG